MAASLAGRVMGVSTASLRATLKNFKGVEHRLEFVRELDGVSYVNDSKATNVDSVWYALQSFTSPIVVILGGRDKGNDYGRLIELVKKHVRAIVAIGESADKVAQAFRGRCADGDGRVDGGGGDVRPRDGAARGRGAALPRVRFVRLVRELRAPGTRLQGDCSGHQNMIRQRNHIDLMTLLAVVTLMVLSLGIVYSASATWAMMKCGRKRTRSSAATR